jgi:hypothetical protein
MQEGEGVIAFVGVVVCGPGGRLQRVSLQPLTRISHSLVGSVLDGAIWHLGVPIRSLRGILAAAELALLVEAAKLVARPI